MDLEVRLEVSFLFLQTFTLETIDAIASSTQWFSFSSPHNTTKLRIHPSTWSASTQLRMDLYGCQVGGEHLLTYKLPEHTLVCETLADCKQWVYIWL